MDIAMDLDLGIDMLGPGAARWVEPGQKNQRSARILDATWEQHKELLCTLYKDHTLPDVMNYMELRCNFKASKRQYGYRFEKWGIKKYNSGGEKRSPMKPVEDMDNYLERMNEDPFVPAPQDVKLEMTPCYLSNSSVVATAGSYSPSSLSAISDSGTFFPDSGSEFEDPISSPVSPISPIVYSLDHDEEFKRRAADFCSAMSDDDNAFLLYADVYKTQSNKPGSSAAARNMLAISCVRAAEQTDNARQASQFLAHHQSQGTSYENSFLMSMLQATTRKSAGDGEAEKMAVQNSICNAVQGILASDNTLLDLPHGYRAIDLVTYQYLSNGLQVYERALASNGLGHTFSSDHVLNSYVSKQPVARHDCFPLRSCVEWCSTQLSCNPTIPPEIAAISCDDDAQRRWRDNIFVFCALWDLMLQDAQHGGAQLDWYDECESALRISPSELLVTVCWLIGGQTGPRSPRTGISEAEADDNDNVLGRAAAGALVVAQWSEGDLWTNFLRKLVWMSKFVDPTPRDKTFMAVVFEHTRQYISRALGVALPLPAQDSYAGLSFLDQMSSFTSSGDSDFLAHLTT